MVLFTPRSSKWEAYNLRFITGKLWTLVFRERLAATLALNHSWIVNRSQNKNTIEHQKLKRFLAQRKWRVSRNCMMSKLIPSEMKLHFIQTFISSSSWSTMTLFLFNRRKCKFDWFRKSPNLTVLRHFRKQYNPPECLTLFSVLR